MNRNRFNMYYISLTKQCSQFFNPLNNQIMFYNRLSQKSSNLSHTLITRSPLLTGHSLVTGPAEVGQRIIRITSYHLRQCLIRRSPDTRRGGKTNSSLLLNSGVVWCVRTTYGRHVNERAVKLKLSRITGSYSNES